MVGAGEQNLKLVIYMFENLTEENVVLYAAKQYHKPNMVLSELEEDYSRILYIKRLLTKYYSSGVLKDRLILNHLTVIYNVFGIECATRILFLKLEEKDHKVIAPFLLLLNFLPSKVSGINGKDYQTDEIELDEGAVKCLREIR